VKHFKLNEEFADQIARSENAVLFEKIMQKLPNANANIVVRTLETTMNELGKENADISNINDEHLMHLFRLHSDGKVPNEAIGNILKIIASKPELTADKAARMLGIGVVEMSELEKTIDTLVESKMDFIREKGLDSVGPLMGVVMKDFRGKVSGQEVSRLLKDRIARKLGDNQSNQS